MYNDFGISPKKHIKQISSIQKPIKVICAENGLKKAGEKYYKHTNEPKDFVIITSASHCFEKKGTKKKLFEETYKRIRKYS